jgi:diguanylate cyclase (GGDEF)-like protein
VANFFQGTSIRSILIIPLQYRHQCLGYLSIFRNGYDTEILWAGRCDSDERNFMPRQSFEAWREIKKEQIPQWSQDEIKLAQSIGIHLYMAVMQKRVESLLRHQAYHDRLTSLPNRLLFDEQLSLALANAYRQGEMLAVAFLDLDRFKIINDTLGHDVGDQILQQATQRMQKCLRQSDTIARWGGDEFTLLLPHIHQREDISSIARQILEILSAPFFIADRELYVTASLGIALAPYDGEDASELLKNADISMYHAKQQGRNNYQFYSPEMNTKGREQLELAGDLRKALSKNEFRLYYQPQVDLSTGEIVSMEALIRWQHPQLGIIPPNQFIPLAEETGLICPIGEWVIRTACIQHRAWRKAGFPPLRIAVNLSARQFQQQGLVKTIIKILNSTQVEPAYLELEITESIAMQDINLTIKVLQELRQMGIRIAMDDFGTGYSSLSTLKYFPLHTLKIDRSFIKDSIVNPSDAAIAKAVVALGKGLNLRILAEGVETKEQLAFLRSIGCDAAQGYFFSKPLPSEAAIQLLIK